MAASLAAPQKDADRIGVGNYILCNFCIRTSMGLCTPREPLLKSLPNSLCILCMGSASILDPTIILLEIIATHRLR